MAFSSRNFDSHVSKIFCKIFFHVEAEENGSTLHEMFSRKAFSNLFFVALRLR